MGVVLISWNAAELEARLPGTAADFGGEPELALMQSADKLNAGLPDGVTTQGQLFVRRPPSG